MSYSLEQILSWTGGRVVNGVHQAQVRSMAPLECATADQIAFFFSKEYQTQLLQSRAGILITADPFVKPLETSGLPLWKNCAIVNCPDPYLAMAILSAKFAQISGSTAAHLPEQLEQAKREIHSSAQVHPTAEIGEGVHVGPHVTIEQGAKIGKGTVLYPGVYIGSGAKLGECCVLFPNVTVYEWSELGNRVRVHANSVIGSDGFGYAPKREGGKVIGHQKIYHLGRVVIGDDVEIGASTSVDRGTIGETVLEKNAKLDNQVQIGHNAKIREGAVLCGGVCVAGGSEVGRYAYVGGLTGVSNRVVIGEGASIGACSLISKDVPPGSAALGNPQREHREHFKLHAMLNKWMDERRSKKGSANHE